MPMLFDQGDHKLKQLVCRSQTEFNISEKHACEEFNLPYVHPNWPIDEKAVLLVDSSLILVVSLDKL